MRLGAGLHPGGQPSIVIDRRDDAGLVVAQHVAADQELTGLGGEGELERLGITRVDAEAVRPILAHAAHGCHVGGVRGLPSSSPMKKAWTIWPVLVTSKRTVSPARTVNSAGSKRGPSVIATSMVRGPVAVAVQSGLERESNRHR